MKSIIMQRVEDYSGCDEARIIIKQTQSTNVALVTTRSPRAKLEDEPVVHLLYNIHIYI